jgi:hypothetical protein
VSPLAIPLASIPRCFDALIPGLLATCSADGVPNIIALTDIHLVDERHVAVSRQFFRKTHENLTQNPRAQLTVTEPYSQEAYRLAIRFDHEETSGPLFDSMATRLQAVASMTGMTSVFHLASSMVFEVLAIERVAGALRDDLEAPPAEEAVLATIDAMTEMRTLRRVSDCLRGTDDLETLLDRVLATLDEVLGFAHSMILLVDETGERLYAIASHGYPESGVGAEVRVGEGVIGTVAQTRRLLRVASVSYARRYGRSARPSVESPPDEIPLPGLADAESQIAIPLVVKDELLGVLAVESRVLLAYGEREEAFVDVVAGQVALAVDNLLHHSDESGERTPAEPGAPRTGRARKFLFYAADDCMFVDGQYLIRNVPGRILWKLLRAFVDEGRTEFTNRELRLDAALGLPSLRDNLESRLILLRKRLAEKCADVGLVPNGRGRFTLEVRCPIELAEKR